MTEEEKKKIFKRAEYMLYEYKHIDSKLDILNFKIANLKNDISIKAVNFDERTGPTNAFNSVVENEIVKRDEKLSKLDAEKKMLEYNKELTEKVLNLLSSEELNLVKLRYFSKPTKSWNSIAIELCQSVDSCIRTRRRIISTISELIC